MYMFSKRNRWARIAPFICPRDGAGRDSAGQPRSGPADHGGGVLGARPSAVGGSGTAPVWRGLVRNAAPQSRLSAQ